LWKKKEKENEVKEEEEKHSLYLSYLLIAIAFEVAKYELC